MAPGRASSVSSSSADFRKPDPSHSRVAVGRRNPPMLRMVLEALQAGERRQGTSVVAIKVYILHKYPTVDASRFKYLLKQALDTGMRRGLLTRPANSKARGATGSFKLIPKNKNLARRMGTLPAPRKAADAKRAGPKKPREPKRGSANVATMEKAPTKPKVASKAHPCLGTAPEKAPKRANQARNAGAKPPKSDKVLRAPSGANGFSGTSKEKGSGSRQAPATQAGGKTKADREPSKPSASKVHNGAASPAKRKMAASAHKGTAIQGAEVGPKTKAASQSGGPKAQPTHAARKTEVPKSPRRPRAGPGAWQL